LRRSSTCAIESPPIYFIGSGAAGSTPSRRNLQTQRVEAKVELALAFQAQKMPKGPALSFAYHARQAEFAAAIRQLNRVGAAALSADERQEVVDTLLRSSQQPELIA
jgi:hypothetical protein